MYVNSGYLNNSRVDFKDYTRPLIVGSCGTYRLYQHPVLPTRRPKGRVDYQLLYVAAGKAHFFFDEQEQIVEAGNIVVYRPGEPQRYVYYVEDHPEVFWVHFTGYDATNILKFYKLLGDHHVFYTGTLPEYKWLFRRMIKELQLCRPYYEELCASLLNDLFILIDRQMEEGHKSNSNTQDLVDTAVSFFNENYNQKICMDDYANSLHISSSWFIKNFRQYIGMTPSQYILSLRMTNAQSLLENTDYNVTQIASIVGYENSLYFSRVFKKELGVSPAQYRKQKRQELAELEDGSL